MYRSFFKRVIDFVIALSILLLFSPLLLIIIIWLHFANKGAGVFFRQERPGKNGRIFEVIKFKSMTDERDRQGYLLPDEDRLTRVGKLIRSTSLDELPQLINVLKGDMYNQIQARRHEVRPGITGWAQVNGRNTISWQQRFEYDVWYVEHISFYFDLKIFFLTIKKTLAREGINSQTSATMEDFVGNDNR